MHYQVAKYALALPSLYMPTHILYVQAHINGLLLLGEAQSECILTRDISVDQISCEALSRIRAHAHIYVCG